MKTTVKQIASVTFIALLLLVGNVKADGIETKVSSQETVETTLQVKNWMTNETVWNTNSLNIMEFASIVEADLELESWMTNAESWNVEDTNVEPELSLENWMIDSEVWK